MDFGQALTELKAGKKLKRENWKNLSFVYFVPGSTFSANKPPLNHLFPEGTQLEFRSHIDGCGADGVLGVWVPSMVDILAGDWVEVIE